MTSSSNDDGYAGQRSPTDTSSEFNAISFLIESALSRISTMKLVKVVNVTNSGGLTAVGFVDVLPLVNQVDGDGNATPHATVFNVPYTRIQGGINAIIMDPVKGDIGWMVVSDRDISGVKTKKDATTPGSFRRYDIADGVYIGGILNAVPQQYVQFQDTGITIADKNGNKLVSSVAGWVFTGIVTMNGNLQLGGSMLSAAGTTYAGNITTSGDVVASGKSLASHKHLGITPGSGVSGIPQ